MTTHAPGRVDAAWRVRDAMLEPKTLPATATVGDVRTAFENDHVMMVLLAEGDAFTGAIERGAVPEELDAAAPAADLARRDVPSIAADAPLSEAVEWLDAHDARRLLVLGDAGRALEGLLCLTRPRTGFCGAPRDIVIER